MGTAISRIVKRLWRRRAAADGRYSALRLAGFAIAVAFRAIPRARRFHAAVALARRLQPLIARTSAYAERARLHTDDLREISLELLLMMLTRHRTTFDPDLVVTGTQHLPGSGHGPTLIVGPHTMLSTLFVRYLEDAGYEPVIVTADPAMGVPGTRMPARVLCPSSTLLLNIRRYFAEGRTVAAMIDRGTPERRGCTVHTDRGAVFVSDALLRLGTLHRAHVVFIATKMDCASRIVTRLSAPPNPACCAAELTAAFARFVEESARVDEPVRA